MNSYKRDYLCLFVIAIAVVVFFSPHLFPLRMYLAGDLGLSDFTDLFWPFKSYLADSLRQGVLPLWSSNVGSGFPMLGEGEIQLFSPTTILYRLFSLPLAFHLNVIIAYILNGFGVYFLGRELTFARLGALFAALGYTFAAPFVLALEHLTIYTAVVGLSWSWLVVVRWVRRSENDLCFWPYGVILALIWALQLFQFSPQVSLLTMSSSTVLFLILRLPSRSINPDLWISGIDLRSAVKSSLLIGVSVFLALLLAAPQVFPSWEMHQNSNRQEPFGPETTENFSLTVKRLANFVIPFALSNPSSPPAYFSFDEGPSLWETNGYIGLATLFFALGGVLFIKSRRMKLFAWMGLISLFLSFGPKTFFGYLLRIFPFSAFRVPGRFLILVDLCLALLAGWFITFKLMPLLKRIVPARIVQLVAPALILIQILDLFAYGMDYNASAPAQEILNPPNTARWIMRDPARYITLRGWYIYNSIFLAQPGWKGKGEAYIPFQETLFPNINLQYDVPGTSAYGGMKIERANKLDGLLQGYFAFHTEERIARTNYHNTEAILNFTATRYLISPLPITIPIKPIAQVSIKGIPEAEFLYRLPEEPPRAWFTDALSYVPSGERLFDLLQPGVLARQSKLYQSAWVENPLDEYRTACASFTTDTQSSRLPQTITDQSDHHVTIAVEAPSCGFVILADTFYPGWEARLDDKLIPIHQVNYNYRGVIVPEGKHTLRFEYRPRSLRRGIYIAVATWIILGAIFVLKRFRHKAAIEN